MPRPKRKITYPPAKTATKRAPAPQPDPNYERPNLATINLTAGAGRAGFAVGDRVRIEAAGIYSGQIAVIERLSVGVIPSALVRTEGGGTRQVRTIDLVPAQTESAQAESAQTESAQAESPTSDPESPEDPPPQPED
ncbi:MAG: hypothetical protein WD830_04315 [Chloroflexota bacterium]